MSNVHTPTHYPQTLVVTVTPEHLALAKSVDNGRLPTASVCPIMQALAEQFPSPTFTVTAGTHHAAIEYNHSRTHKPLTESIYRYDPNATNLLDDYDHNTLASSDLPQTITLTRMN